MHRPFRAILAIACLIPVAPAAWALEPADTGAIAVPAASDAMPQATDAVASDPLFTAPLAVGALDDLRGGTDNHTVITNVSDVDGTVDGNTAINAVTGGNLVDGGAFNGAAGLSTVIQNSGNNVLIQNSTVVSVQFAPSP